MSLFGTMSTAVSGMSAQASYLGTVSDNIANSATTGYKSANSYFETLLGNQTPSSYTSGGVQTLTRYAIGDQGTISNTSSVTDLAISGGGFFIVKGSDGSTALTRAGSFVPDSNGNLVNTAGFQLQGYPITPGSSGNTDTSPADLQTVTVPSGGVAATPSSSGTLSFNAPSNAAVVTGSTPANNVAGSTYTAKTSLTAYDNLGNAVNLDVYLTKTASSGGSSTWEATVFNQAGAAAGGGFPYSSGPLSTQTLTFSNTTGALTAVNGASSPLALSVPVPNGNTVSINIASATQLAAGFSVASPTIDGNAPSTVKGVAIGTDGTLSVTYSNGQSKPLYRIPLATVPSEDNLTSVNGNAYQTSAASGSMTIGVAGAGTFGKIESSSLENSDVDLATQLTNMIASQRSYEANSKVIQASSDLLKSIEQLNG